LGAAFVFGNYPSSVAGAVARKASHRTLRFPQKSRVVIQGVRDESNFEFCFLNLHHWRVGGSTESRPANDDAPDEIKDFARNMRE